MAASPNLDHQVDPQELENANRFWNRFIVASKVGIAASVIILVLMALFLL